ncbi:C-GCAxxG-C-C family protein [Dethiobacter alkaliphilus]|uniref:C-GCAxxG-C-C family protein n=1 Tax=Dethiobacter alkaliphilus TaxID=427926 RepID=UPI002227A8E9|nr:C-GCAxxG-C-C family protein [Dethiobacter alkaliphilus]MCW3491384.1 C-GCAxxG-C-C family protein [Dethiobacter alkaliphilus]
MGYLAEEVGYPFNQIPTEAFGSYRGGVEGWGSICGALVPAISVINLVVEKEDRASLVNELMAWYKEFPFPEFQPAGLDLPGVPINSSLCHVSVTKWMEETGYGPRSSPERGERCAGLTADVSKFTAAMLNKYFEESSYTGQYAVSPATGQCMACHEENVKPYAHGKEDCVECHGDPHED